MKYSMGWSFLSGSLLIAIGINCFLLPHHILEGGLIGGGLILNYLFKIPVGLGMFMLSFPLFLMCFFYLKDYFYASLMGLAISSLMIDVVYPYHYYIVPYLSLNSIISAMMGGVFVGWGTGLMMRAKITTGGTEMIAFIIKKLIKTPLALNILIIDATLIMFGAYLISTDIFFPSLLSIATSTLVTSLIIQTKVTYT